MAAGTEITGGDLKRPAEILCLPCVKLVDHPLHIGFYTESHLEGLVASIRESGLLEPVVVCPVGNDEYRILSGHYRIRSVRRLKWKTVMCRVVMCDQRTSAIIYCTSNLLTRGLSAIEEGYDEAGNGKSTLIDIFLSQISSTRYKIIHIPVPQNKPRELYRSISAAMGVNTSWFGADALKVLDMLTYSYIESGRPSLILIGEAHTLSPATLNELRLLANAKVKNDPLVTLMLFGQQPLSSTLKLPAMIPLAQRVGAWITLTFLTEEESTQYIDWQHQNAGAKRESFLQAAKKAVYRRSQGNHRMINRLAWESLNQGRLDSAEVITEELFAHVCKNLGAHLGN